MGLPLKLGVTPLENQHRFSSGNGKTFITKRTDLQARRGWLYNGQS
jgi:hypothetical protein